jgi:hypothetical protein
MKTTKTNVAIVAKKALLPLIYSISSKCATVQESYFAKITNVPNATAKFNYQSLVATATLVVDLFKTPYNGNCKNRLS